MIISKKGNLIVFDAIDTHTEGEPTRTIIGGISEIPGCSMKDKMFFMMNHADWIRKNLCFEPRGNSVMSGTILTKPCRDDADIGVLYFEVGGWMPMCGHDTIGAATAIIAANIVPVDEPYTYINFDTASGLVRVKVEVSSGKAKGVTFENAPAFVMKLDVPVSCPNFGQLYVDIAYGGNVYAILPANTMGLSINTESASKIINAGNILKDAINKQVPLTHPYLPFINKVTHIEFYETLKNSDANVRNAVVIPPGAIDRSPCGTGTSAKMAVLAARGKLSKGDSFVHESIIGSKFYCRILENTEVCGIPAIVPEIKGRAYITGKGMYCIEPDDPFPEGFVLS